MKLSFTIRNLFWLILGVAVLMAVVVFIRNEWNDYQEYMNDQIRASEASRAARGG